MHNHLIYFFWTFVLLDFFVVELSFFVNTCICEYGAKCKFDHPKDKGGSPKIYEQKGNGDSSITEGI